MYKTYKPWQNSWKSLPVAVGALQHAASRYKGPGPNARYIPYSRNNGSLITADRPASKRRRYSFKQKVKSTEPAKHSTVAPSQNPMKADTLYTFSPTQAVTQGTGNTNRLGDSIELQALKVKGFFNTASPTGAYTFRIIVGFSGEEYSVASTFGSGLGGTEIFLPSTTTNWVANGIVNPKAFTALYDQTFDINSMIASASENQSYAFTVPINQTFNYQASASTMGKFKNLYIVIVGNVFGGTTGTTDIGAAFMATDLIFKE